MPVPICKFVKVLVNGVSNCSSSEAPEGGGGGVEIPTLPEVNPGCFLLVPRFDDTYWVGSNNLTWDGEKWVNTDGAACTLTRISTGANANWALAFTNLNFNFGINSGPDASSGNVTASINHGGGTGNGGSVALNFTGAISATGQDRAGYLTTGTAAGDGSIDSITFTPDFNTPFWSITCVSFGAR